MPLLAIIFLVISQPLQVKFWWCRKLKKSLIPAWAELGPAQFQLVSGVFVKLQSSLTVQSKSVGLGVDFVFPPSQLTTRTTNNPHQNLPEGKILHIPLKLAKKWIWSSAPMLSYVYELKLARAFQTKLFSLCVNFFSSDQGMVGCVYRSCLEVLGTKNKPTITARQGA